MPNHPSLIVIGTSAGGMPALIQLLSQLPLTLPAAVVVVQHLAPNSSSEFLVARLSESTVLPCHVAHHNMHMHPGNVYFCQPDRHLLVKGQHLLVTKGPHENNFRPSIDSLFRSAAVEFGAGVIGVVLTGMLHDGTAGLDFIRRCGGITVVQDPNDAEFASMPESALRSVPIDYVVPLTRMGGLLQELVRQQIDPNNSIPEDLKMEAAIAERVVGSIEDVNKIGHQVALTCPDCGGNLWQIDKGKVLRYRCHTGHSYTAESLLDRTQDSLEETLWVALRMMEERKNLLTGMASRGEGYWSVQQEERVNEMKAHINRLREFLLNGKDVDGAARATVEHNR
ncbi:chemotaxis protein CheB [Hymenobacter sp. GOD-10R]|uniref:chemotaxis protein CheB n=1 Tax=Hymenobacter sp. GOD-10R TaxID=3093922 RepID=UPI002D79C886|nr:chemotaxis protein CheB [Hymenobacter sp. GOD-10R]WRQ30575.1 chemotaxis protein CheB [Hymenobacter sp. GOD-10R]